MSVYLEKFKLRKLKEKKVKKLTDEWVDKWRFKLPVDEKAFEHISQLKGRTAE